MARNFNGTSARIQVGLGNVASITGAYTMASIFRRSRSGSAGWDMPLVVCDSGNAGRLALEITSSSGAYGADVWACSSNTVNGDSGYTGAGGTLGAGDVGNWIFGAHTRTAGAAQVPISYLYRYVTNAWTIANHNAFFDATSRGNPPSLAGGNIVIGAFRNGATFSDFFGGDIGIDAVWNRVLTPAEIQLLPFFLAPWLTALDQWPLWQDNIAQKVRSLSGSGSVETAITATTVAAASLPMFSVGAPVLFARRQPSGAAPETHSGAAASTGGGNSTATGRKGAARAATTTGGGTSAEVGRKGAIAAIATTGGGASAATGRKGAAASLTTTGGGASTATGRKGAQRAVTDSTGGTSTATGTKNARAAAATTGGGTSSATGSAGSASNRNGVAAATGGGGSTASGRKGAASAPQTTGGGACLAQGRKGALRAVATSGGGSSHATGSSASNRNGSCSTSGGGSSSAAGRKSGFGVAASTGGGSSVAAWRKAARGSCTTSGGGASRPAWRKATSGTATTTGGGTSQATGFNGLLVAPFTYTLDDTPEFTYSPDDTPGFTYAGGTGFTYTLDDTDPFNYGLD